MTNAHNTEYFELNPHETDTEIPSSISRVRSTAIRSRFTKYSNMIMHYRKLSVFILGLASIVIFLGTTLSKSSQVSPSITANSLSHTFSEPQLGTFISAIPPNRVIQTYLNPLLIPRVASTPGNDAVRNFIVQTLTSLNFHIELDSFNDTTPLGVKSFANIIATKFPDAPKKLVLASHYDSKYFPSGDFIAATDSSAPCAILLDVAVSLNILMEKATTLKDGKQVSLQLIFFDGEEAFVEWNETDSLYGSRHLAAKWAETFIFTTASSTPQSILSMIEVLVLLDLLGTNEPPPTIHNLQPFTTTSQFDKFVEVEERLLRARLIMKPGQLSRNSTSAKRFLNEDHINTELIKRGAGGIELQPYFVRRKSQEEYIMNQPMSIEDDHIPFMRRGVPIVHIIPVPFPTKWHNLGDDNSTLSAEVIINWNRIVTVWTAEYLGLAGIAS